MIILGRRNLFCFFVSAYSFLLLSKKIAAAPTMAIDVPAKSKPGVFLGDSVGSAGADFARVASGVV